jgi:hypothetical protein
MIVGGVFGLLVVGFLGGSLAHPSFTNALTGPPEGGGVSCDVKRVGTNDAGGVDSRFILNADGTVTARFRVTGTDCHMTVTLVSWNAPNGTDGKPYEQQTLFAKTTAKFTTGDHTITAKMPNCFYQIDLVTGSDVSMYPTTSFSSQGRLRGNLHGGAQPCTVPTPTPTPAPTPVVETASTTLPNTGPGEIAIVAVLALAGGYIFHLRHLHKQRRLAHATHHVTHRGSAKTHRAHKKS